MSTTTDKPEPQSAAAPSPFPPIADYAFLSNCHTAALIAPDGAVDWLCIPGFESPSAFGSLLDRQAGFFRFGPFGINVPSGRTMYGTPRRLAQKAAGSAANENKAWMCTKSNSETCRASHAASGQEKV